MKIFYCKHLPSKNFSAINLFGLIIVRKDYGQLDASELNHEVIHSRQMMEMLFFPFYFWYGIEWLIRLIQYRSRYEAYKNVSFEREAYAKMYDLSYLDKRRMFSFVYYLRKKTYL